MSDEVDPRAMEPRRSADQTALEIVRWVRVVTPLRLAVGLLCTLAGSALGFWLSHQDLKAQTGNAVTMASTAVREVKRVEDTVQVRHNVLTEKIDWSVALVEALATDACKRSPATMGEAGVPCDQLRVPRALKKRP